MKGSYFKKGIIEHIGDIETVGKDFQKRLIVLRDEQRVNKKDYVAFPSFEATGNKMGMLDDFKTGDHVEIEFFVRGVRYQKDGNIRYFNTLSLYNINETTIRGKKKPEDDTESVVDTIEEDQQDDLPF